MKEHIVNNEWYVLLPLLWLESNFYCYHSVIIFTITIAFFFLFHGVEIGISETLVEKVTVLENIEIKTFNADMGRDFLETSRNFARKVIKQMHPGALSYSIEIGFETSEQARCCYTYFGIIVITLHCWFISEPLFSDCLSVLTYFQS